MMFNEYQILAAKTAQYPDVFLLSTQQKNKSIKVPAIYASLGLAGEAGEFANKIKIVINKHHAFCVRKSRWLFEIYIQIVFNF